MRNIFRTKRPSNFKLGGQTDGRRPASLTSVTSKVKGQGRKVTWRVWQVLADKSRMKRPRNTKIGGKVVHFTGKRHRRCQSANCEKQTTRNQKQCLLYKALQYWQDLLLFTTREPYTSLSIPVVQKITRLVVVPHVYAFVRKIKCVKVPALLEKNKVRSGAFKSAFTINLKLGSLVYCLYVLKIKTLKI